MVTLPVVTGASSGTHDTRTTPLTGVALGTALSLLLWARILGIVFAIR